MGLLFFILLLTCVAASIAVPWILRHLEQERRRNIVILFQKMGLDATDQPDIGTRAAAFSDLNSVPQRWLAVEHDNSLKGVHTPASYGIMVVARGVLGDAQVLYLEHVIEISVGGSRSSRTIRRFDYTVLAITRSQKSFRDAAGTAAMTLLDMPSDPISIWAKDRNLVARRMIQGDVVYGVCRGRLNPEVARSFTEHMVGVRASKHEEGL